MLSFMEYVCDIYPDRHSLIWLREKAVTCLDKYDNGTEYFTDLKIMVIELEYALSIINKST